jgi:hypothetical protein
MNREVYETALRKLRQLIDASATIEGAFQAWFENESDCVSSLGYVRAIAQPKLVDYESATWEPDLLAQKSDGTWHILELKRADTAVIKDVSRRQTFYSDFETYVTQCRDYSRYFRDPRNRLYAKEHYGVDVGDEIPAILVAGRSDGLDSERIRSILMDRGNRVIHQTYDDVWSSLDHQRVVHFGKFENLPGLSMHMVVTVSQINAKENFIADIGNELDKNRISIFVDNSDRLNVRVLDAEGVNHTIRVPSGKGGFHYDRFFYLNIEVGSSDRGGIVSVYFGNGDVKELMNSTLNIQFPDQVASVICSDILGKARTSTGLAERFDYSRTLTFEERSRLREYLLHKYRWGVKSYIQARGHQFMYSPGHPFLDPKNES